MQKPQTTTRAGTTTSFISLVLPFLINRMLNLTTLKRVILGLEKIVINKYAYMMTITYWSGKDADRIKIILLLTCSNIGAKLSIQKM